ncbi:hypothetical protein CV83915_2p0219 (plasmid) [Escherichia coli]|uniref:Uncharacterized protein n=1 Tax=Escherichia coli TaxID=562 RepID=A0A2H4TL02_ECOLX|nr:hypothetical protein CV83915_2p0219 [Escherichia coli]
MSKLSVAIHSYRSEKTCFRSKFIVTGANMESNGIPHGYNNHHCNYRAG